MIEPSATKEEFLKSVENSKRLFEDFEVLLKGDNAKLFGPVPKVVLVIF